MIQWHKCETCGEEYLNLMQDNICVKCWDRIDKVRQEKICKDLYYNIQNSNNILNKIKEIKRKDVND